MLSQYDFYATGMMKNAMESIPLGNGDLGVNVWAKQDGLYLLFSKTDAWSELGRLLKTGLLHVSFSVPLSEQTRFHLSLTDAVLTICSDALQLRFFVDANHPVYHLEVTSDIPITCVAEWHNYRSEDLILSAEDTSNYAMSAPPEDGIAFDYENRESADKIFSPDENTLGQYHRNHTSCYDFALRKQGLAQFAQKNDPMLHLTFGCMASCAQMQVRGAQLCTKTPCKTFVMDIYSATAQTQTVEQWMTKMRVLQKTEKPCYAKHCDVWQSHWTHSFIEATGSKEAETITRGYLYQRYMNLCAGRGAYPIKFNGSLFTCQVSPHIATENYDYRRWGGLYWIQNTRLIYWSMLFAGDYSMMMPFFRLYLDAMPMAEYRTQLYHGVEGAIFPETMTHFGTYACRNYGANRMNLRTGDIPNRYIRFHFEGALEICAMMLQYCRHTQDTAFLQESVFPFTEKILLFFKNKFEVWDGKLLICPSSALETWQYCADDTPTIAGLSDVTEKLLQMRSLPNSLQNLCKTLQAVLPEIPLENKNGETVIAPCRVKIDTELRNVENPELYAVFPFYRYGIGSKENELALAKRTYAQRSETASCGWQQHGIQAAILGLVDETEKELLAHYTNTNEACTFPAFWGPNYDWLPDQDNGTSANIALTQALVQVRGEQIFILPAWNKAYDVAFRLPIEDGNFVQLVLKDGKIESCTTDVPTQKEIIICG